jgi:hypothetical protein
MTRAPERASASPGARMQRAQSTASPCWACERAKQRRRSPTHPPAAALPVTAAQPRRRPSLQRRDCASFAGHGGLSPGLSLGRGKLETSPRADVPIAGCTPGPKRRSAAAVARLHAPPISAAVRRPGSTGSDPVFISAAASPER